VYQIITLVDGLIHKLSLRENAPRDADKLERLLKVKQSEDKRKKKPCTLRHTKVSYRRD
jgi:hypothetical protein